MVFGKYHNGTREIIFRLRTATVEFVAWYGGYNHLDLYVIGIDGRKTFLDCGFSGRGYDRIHKLAEAINEG